MLPIIAAIVIPALMNSWGMAVSVAADDAAGAPVKIDHCTVSEQAYMENPKIGLRLPQVSGGTIVYTNGGNAAATEIRFRVRYQGATSLVIDRGSFAPGQKISRDFSNLNAIFSSPSADCSVTSVTFADGTHWTAPDEASTAPAHR